MKPYYLSVLLLFGIMSYTRVFTQENETPQSANRKIVLTIFDEAINKKNVTVFHEHYVSDVIDHSAFPGQKPGVDGLTASTKELHETFSDIKVKVEDIVSEGDIVATRESWSATNKASGKKLSGWVLHMFKFKKGKITEEWSKGWEWLSGNQ